MVGITCNMNDNNGNNNNNCWYCSNDCGVHMADNMNFYHMYPGPARLLCGSTHNQKVIFFIKMAFDFAMNHKI